MTAAELTEKVAARPMLRLRWYVLRELGISPCSRGAARLTDRGVLFLAANMVLDRREALRSIGAQGAVNTSFDERKFIELSGGDGK